MLTQACDPAPSGSQAEEELCCFHLTSCLIQGGGNKVLLSNFRAEDLRRCRQRTCPATIHASSIPQQGQKRPPCTTSHHFYMWKRLVFSLFLLSNTKQVFQRWSLTALLQREARAVWQLALFTQGIHDFCIIGGNWHNEAPMKRLWDKM